MTPAPGRLRARHNGRNHLTPDGAHGRPVRRAFEHASEVLSLTADGVKDGGSDGTVPVSLEDACCTTFTIFVTGVDVLATYTVTVSQGEPGR